MSVMIEALARVWYALMRSINEAVIEFRDSTKLSLIHDGDIAGSAEDCVDRIRQHQRKGQW